MKLKNNVFVGVLALPLLFSAGAKADESEEKLAEDMPQAVDRAGQAAGRGAESRVFTLGEIRVTGRREDELAIGTSTISSEEMWDFSKESLEEALNIIPGVSVTPGSGSRNEADISIRGFNRYQVPLYMDGIRLYLPADNRIDMGRFLTPDLSEIQVSKGFVSVLNGPDGMGGAINLVTRKPVKPLEAEARLSAKLGEGGQYGGYTAYANLGSKQDRYYWQASFQQRDIDNWRLSRDFDPYPNSAQGRGERLNTDKNDWRVNLKAGFTPNATDEYSLNFVKQEGEKHGIGSADSLSAISRWDWPTWDTWSLYWLSHTQLGDKSYVKTKVYYSRFENDLVAYLNDNLDAKNFTSVYDDNAYGASVEFGTTALPQQTLKMAVHYRRDDHTEHQINHPRPPANPGNIEPKQSNVEDSYSFALEDTWHVTPTFDLVGAVSRDIRRMKKAEEFTIADGFFSYRLADHFATNWQGAAIWRYREGGKAHFSVSRRHRFPTMFERYASRFGGALSNPTLSPEYALNYELGVSEQILPGLRADVAIFYNKVEDSINSVNVQHMGGTYTQFRNTGKATFRGFEIGLQGTVSPRLEWGGNYTYISTDLDDPNDPNVRLTTTPRHKAFLYARWMPMDTLRIIPSIEYGSPRWSQMTTGNDYRRTGEYTSVDLRLEYRIDRRWDVSLAARNLLDKNYELTYAYPEEGRNFLLSTRYQF